MRRLVQLRAWLAVLLLMAGCATKTEAPQTRDEAMPIHKPASIAGVPRSAVHFVVDRPIGVVVASVAEFRNKCLQERGVSSKIDSFRNGMISLSVQERGRPESAAVSGGNYTLVAEMRPIGTGRTQVDIDHASRGKLVDPLKEWMEGSRRSCPAF